MPQGKERVVEINGIKKSLKQWSFHFQIPYGTVTGRIARKMTPYEALTTPIGPRGGARTELSKYRREVI